ARYGGGLLMLSRNEKRIQELASGKLGAILLKYSWPALVAMSLNALYAVVDRAFIGRCGVDAMAGLTLTMPIMMLFGAFGVFVGAGHSAVLSIKLGEGDRSACEKIVGELVAIKLIFFFILPPLVFFNLDTVLGWCGGAKVSPGALDCARTYLKIVLFSHLFSHLAFGLSAVMRAEGAAISSMTCMIIGFGVNLVLDPVFIFAFDMGVAGAAWATNIAMLASCLYAFMQYWTGKTAVRLRLRRIWLYRRMLVRAGAIGFAPFLQQFLGAGINLSLQLAFARWAADEAAATAQLASLGVFQVMLILTLMPVLGAQQGIQPIIGYNWGARNFRRVKKALVLGFLLTSALCVVACIVQTVPPFPRLMARIFVEGDNPALVSIAAHDLQVANCLLWTIGLNIVATTYFQSIGHPGSAVFLSTMRQGFIMLPVIWFLPFLMENKVLAIWLSMPVSDILCALLTLPFLVHNMRFLSRVRERRISSVSLAARA
ncbi:MAG: polysaccharide biosynthesis C-terminal domain-containing protein, partial [Kiritimatiellae bacterium]|nr:polysaccharide biosynthesis C-terminal domain-containing protein [Kiritimatiellia bacterium]